LLVRALFQAEEHMIDGTVFLIFEVDEADAARLQAVPPPVQGRS